jgi:1,2-diacylglycerol 3-alpha-glucosyltransferase
MEGGGEPPAQAAQDLAQGYRMSGPSVGLFVDSFTPIIDGVTVTVRNYAWWLARMEGRACVVTPRVPGHVDDEGFDVIRFFSLPTVVRPPYRIGFPGLDPGLAARLRGLELDIIHAHSPFGAGHAALRAARERGVPVVATFHSKFRDSLRRNVPVRRLVDDQVRRIVEFFSSVDQVWIPQESVAATLRDYGYTGPCQVVENGTDFAPEPDTAHLRAAGGRHLGLPPDARVGLYVGQLVLEKNLELLLASLPGVIARVPDFRMVMVGEGYARHWLQRLSRRLGIQDRVLFHDVIHDRELLKAVYARGDLFLFPSLYDNAPLVIREAAAVRTPAILVRGSTAAEVIRDGENGFLAGADPEVFADRVSQVLDSPCLLDRAAQGAQRTLCRSWESVAREIRRRYLELLAGWRG